MKILILSFYHPPDISAGSFRIKSLLNQLSQHQSKLEVSVITTIPNRYNSHRTSIVHEGYEEEFDIHRIDIPNHKSGIFDQSKAFIYFVVNAIKISRNIDADIVFATSSRLMTAALAAYIAKIKQVDLILDIRDLFLDTIQDVFNPLINLILYFPIKLIEKFTFRSAKKINVVSEGFKEYIKKIAPKSKILVYTNGIDEEFLKYESCYKSNNKNIKNILYAGNIGEGQGLHKLIPHVAKKLNKEIHFTIIGDGGRFDKLRNIIHKENIQNITLIGAISRSALFKYYDKADIFFLHLNDYKAFKKVLPSKLFEYAALEKPIIAGVEGYAKEFLNKEVPWAQTFLPCNVNDCINTIYNIKSESHNIDGTKFKQKYQRKVIMKEFVNEFFNIG